MRPHHLGQRIAVRQPDHLVSLDRQECGQELETIGLVFDDHNGGHGHRACGSVNQKVLPFPISLSTPISPPCISTSRRDNASPRPVPSYFRLAEASSWENSLNSFA